MLCLRWAFEQHFFLLLMEDRKEFSFFNSINRSDSKNPENLFVELSWTNFFYFVYFSKTFTI